MRVPQAVNGVAFAPLASERCDAFEVLYESIFGKAWPDAQTTINAAETVAFLLLHQKEEAGFFLSRCLGRDAELLTIGVVPERQGQGLGKTLLAEGMARLKARGTSRLFLELAETNMAAHRLYLSAGFTQTGRRRGYYAGPQGASVDALLLARDLA